MGAFVTFWDNDAGSKTPFLANPGAGIGAARQEDSLPESQMELGSLQYPRNPEGSLGALLIPLGPGGWPRLGSSRERLPGNVFRGRAVVFHFRQSKKRGGRSFSLGRLFEQFRDRNALGFAQRRTSKLVGRAATQRNANSKSSPSR